MPHDFLAIYSSAGDSVIYFKPLSLRASSFLYQSGYKEGGMPGFFGFEDTTLADLTTLACASPPFTADFMPCPSLTQGYLI